MSLKATIKDAMKEAMRAKDKSRLETIRMLISAMQYDEIEKKVDDLNDDDTIAVIKRELKKREEEAEFAKQAGRSEILQGAEAAVAVLASFLPAQMSHEELKSAVAAIVAKAPGAQMGVIMGILKKDYAGKYDGKMASEVVKAVLGGK